MSIDNAEKFVEFLKKHKKEAKMMSGFTLEELRKAIEDHIKKDPKLKNWDDFITDVGDGY